MANAYLVSACRTPIGKFRGALASVPVGELGAVAVRAAVERSGVDPANVDEVILGNVLSAGVGQAPARQAALKAGLPATVAAVTVNKVCGSGLKAVMLAAQAVRCGDAHVVVAGGMESMSRAGLVLPRESPPLGDRTLVDTLQYDGLTCAFSGRSMGDIAESTAEKSGVSRADQDRFAAESHRRAIASIDAGRFNDEIVPVTVRNSRGTNEVIIDEGPRRETSVEQLGTLRPVFRANGTVTAGNASMISDGAAAVVVVSEDALQRFSLTPWARIVASVTVGGAPEDIFTAPIESIRQVVARGGLSLGEIDLFELNEAFAAQMLACMKPLELPVEKVNVNGGAIALGHPIGASGARVLVTLLYALRQRDGRYGVASLCLGGGNAVAMVVEKVG